MTEFVPSPEILVLRQQGNLRLVRHPRHEDFAVLLGAVPVAQGGPALMERVFRERTGA